MLPTSDNVEPVYPDRVFPFRSSPQLGSRSDPPSLASPAGDGDAGDAAHVELVAIRTPSALWPPARRFWASFLIADPLALSPLGNLTSTEVSMARHMDDVRSLADTVADDFAAFDEKLKAIAAYAVYRTVALMASGNAEGQSELKRLMLEVMDTPAEVFGALWSLWPTLATKDHEELPPTDIRRSAWLALRLAPSGWIRKLGEERERLSAAPT